MERRIAVVGDKLTSGGRILDYAQQPGFTFAGHKVALSGNEAFCTTCKSTGRIAKAGGPYRIKCNSVRELALDRDIVRCKCPTPPRIIATLAGQAWCDDRNHSYMHGSVAAEANDTSRHHEQFTPLDARGRASKSQIAIYDQQYTLTDDTGRSLSGVHYRVRVGSSVVASGVTNAGGKTERITTDACARLRLEVSY